MYPLLEGASSTFDDAHYLSCTFRLFRPFDVKFTERERSLGNPLSSFRFACSGFADVTVISPSLCGCNRRFIQEIEHFAQVNYAGAQKYVTKSKYYVMQFWREYWIFFAFVPFVTCKRRMESKSHAFPSSSTTSKNMKLFAQPIKTAVFIS